MDKDKFREELKTAYNCDLFEVYEVFLEYYPTATLNFSNEAIALSDYAKEIGILSIGDLWNSYKNGGNKDSDVVFLEVIHYLDSKLDGGLYEDRQCGI